MNSLRVNGFLIIEGRPRLKFFRYLKKKIGADKNRNSSFQIHSPLGAKLKVPNASSKGKGRDPITHLSLQQWCNDAERGDGIKTKIFKRQQSESVLQSIRESASFFFFKSPRIPPPPRQQTYLLWANTPLDKTRWAFVKTERRKDVPVTACTCNISRADTFPHTCEHTDWHKNAQPHVTTSARHIQWHSKPLLPIR